MDKFMMIALKEAKKAFDSDEIPVGAVIVKDNKIISKDHNRKEKDQIVTSHAEILAIEKANKKLKSWRLNGCTIYITLEPCMMCSGAISQSKIKKVIYGTENYNLGFSKELEKENIEIYNIKNEECKCLITSFFENKRKH